MQLGAAVLCILNMSATVCADKYLLVSHMRDGKQTSTVFGKHFEIYLVIWDLFVWLTIFCRTDVTAAGLANSVFKKRILLQNYPGTYFKSKESDEKYCIEEIVGLMIYDCSYDST